MKTSPRKWNFKSIAGKIMLGLVLITMVSSINLAPAFAKNNHKSEEEHDNGRYQHRGRGYDARPAYRHYNYYGQRERVYYPHDYHGQRERVYYPPPPVVYAPPPPPGIGIFFPPVFIRP